MAELGEAYEARLAELAESLMADRRAKLGEQATQLVMEFED